MHTIYQFYKLLHNYIKLFPKAEKYSLGQRIENLTLDTLELAFRASYASKVNRSILLEDLDAKVQILKTLIRLAHEIRALDDNKYLALQENLQEMGKMVGGWIRSLKTNNTNGTLWGTV
ncbi:MAG: diversity-generating retroelement protein Avd [Patescibacteria group bacterium]